MTTTENGARDQAQAQLERIRMMLERLEHARECDGEDCNLDWEDTELTNGMREDYHDEDSAYNAIMEDPLEVFYRSDWQSILGCLEPDEYMILLCTDRPAVCIEGDLGRYREATSARLLYQEWFTEWQTYPTYGRDDEILLEYAEYFVGY